MARLNKLVLSTVCFLSFAAASILNADTQKEIVKPVKTAVEIQQDTQKREEQWRLEKDELSAEYEVLQKEIELLKNQNNELNRQAGISRERLAAKEKQLNDIEQISDQIQPFLEQLIADMENRISESLPFLTGERNQRINKLKDLMLDPDVSFSEKYRKVMEAMLVEAEYGFTIEVYQDTISVDGQSLLADILRLGRLSLYYLSLDRKHCGFYNIVDKNWQPLSQSYIRNIQAASDIAARRRTTELLTLPIGRIVP